MTAVPKRRWFRYSLRTLFVAVTVAAVLAGGIAWAARSGLLPIDYVIIFQYDTYLIGNWQGVALLAAVGLVGVVLVAGLVSRRIR